LTVAVPFERVQQYRVLEPIGRGGMGEIHAARDERLGRIVALKTIPVGAVPDPQARARLLAEARAAASLSHPFICTIHEAIEYEGAPVIVMEYVRGETVAQWVSAGPLPPHDVSRIGREVAEALAAAHARGIIHRDISAANIMLAEDGHAKVMDFGLAESTAARTAVMDATVTAAHATAGLVLGTPAYVAPEILRGQPATAQSDLYALGVVMYLMATGRLPFPAETMAGLVAAVLTDTAVAPRSIVPALPWALEAVIMRLLAKDPANRYASAGAVAEALASPSTEAPGRGASRSVAVLPFRPLGQASADADLGVGLADATITDLAAVRSLLVRPTSAILPYAQRAVDPVQAGRELSVDAVVDGSLQRSGSRVRVTVQLLSTSDGRPMWGTKVDASLEDVFVLQDQVSREIVKALEIELTDADERRLDRVARGTSAAQEHYLRGRVHMLHEDREHVDAAIREFEQALAVQPGFPLAYIGLASAFGRIAFTFDPDSDYYARAAEMPERALSLDPQLPEGRYLRARLAWTPNAHFQHETAIREAAAAIDASPGLYEAHDILGVILAHVSMFEEAARELERSLAINPRDGFAYMHLGLARLYGGEWNAALEISQEVWRREPSPWAAYQLALAHLQLGQLDEAERISAAGTERFPSDVLFYPLNGVMAALRGDTALADAQVQRAIEHKRAFGHYHHAQYDIACIHALAGREPQALEWLEAAAANGFPCAGFFRRDRLLDSLRTLEPFVQLLGRLESENLRYRQAYAESRQHSTAP
jgi:TolB-like protein/Flp pilus assembly protein TadD